MPTEREKLTRRLAYMRYGLGRPPQHASDAVKSKHRAEVEKLRKRLRDA